MHKFVIPPSPLPFKQLVQMISSLEKFIEELGACAPKSLMIHMKLSRNPNQISHGLLLSLINYTIIIIS